MPKVNCQWATCKYNTANTPGEYGECTQNVVNLEHIDADELDLVVDDEDWFEGLDCKSYNYGGFSYDETKESQK